MISRTPSRAALRRTGVVATNVIGALGGDAWAEMRALRFNKPQNIGVFGLVWQTDYFEPAFEGTFADARLVVNSNTEPGARLFRDAADIVFQHQLPTTTLLLWNVRGSDVGWNGTDVFTASLSTSVFNGQPLIAAGTSFCGSVAS